MKKIILIAIVAIATVVVSYAQYSTYYHQRRTLFENLPTSKKDIIFVGNSITDGGEWSELLNNENVKNRGISGDVTAGVLNRLSTITKGEPSKIFILIGINDVSRGTSAKTIVREIAKIVAQIKTESPKTTIYLQSILPVSGKHKLFTSHTNKIEVVKEANTLLSKLATTDNITYIDLYPEFIDPTTGELDSKYSNDGLHLLGEGYVRWAQIVKPYIQ